MAKTIEDVIFVGIRGTVLALDRASGAQIWQTALKGSEFVNVVLDRGQLFATTRGEVSCLNPSNGRIIWTNPMRGLGYGLITVTPGSCSAPAMAQHRQQQANDESAMQSSNIVMH